MRQRWNKNRGNRLAINTLRLKIRRFLAIQKCAEGIKVMVGTSSIGVALVQWKSERLTVQPLVILSITD